MTLAVSIKIRNYTNFNVYSKRHILKTLARVINSPEVNDQVGVKKDLRQSTDVKPVVITTGLTSHHCGAMGPKKRIN